MELHALPLAARSYALLITAKVSSTGKVLATGTHVCVFPVLLLNLSSSVLYLSFSSLLSPLLPFPHLSFFLYFSILHVPHPPFPLF